MFPSNKNLLAQKVRLLLTQMQMEKPAINHPYNYLDKDIMLTVYELKKMVDYEPLTPPGRGG